MKEKKENNAAVEEAYSKAMEEVYAEAKKKGKKSATSGDGTETDAVMPWYKKHMKALMITAAVIIVIVAAVMTGLILYGNYYQSLTRGVLLYQDGGSMMSEKLFQDAVYSNQWDTWNFNEKGADNNENTAVVTTDGKYIYYAMNGNGTSFDLYYAKKGSSREVLISQGVTDYEVVGRGELYYAANGVFYRYNVKGAETQNLCSRATTFTLNGKKDTVLMLGEDGSLSSMEINNVGSLKILETDVTKIEAVAGDFRTIVYHKEDGLYMLTTKSGQKDKITKDFTECYVCNIDKKCEVYYLNEGRELFYFKSGDTASYRVAGEVWGLLGAEQNAGMFFAATGPISELCEYRLITSGEAITMKDAPVMKLGEEFYFDASAKKVYFIGYSRDDNTKGTLYSMGYQMFEKGKVEAVEQNVVFIDYVEKGGMYIGKDGGNGSVDLYCNNSLVARNVIPNSVSMSADGRAVVFAYRVSAQTGDRVLAMYDGVSIKEIGSCAGDNYCAVSEKEVYLLQYADNDDGFNLLKYNGRKLKTQLEGIDNFRYLFY